MLLFRVELHTNVGGQFDRLAVHPRADEAFTREPFDHVSEFSLLILDRRRQQHHAGFGWKCQNPVNDVAGGLVRDRLTADRTMCPTDVGEQQTQIVVNLRGGGDGRSRIRAGAALLDGNGRRESFDVIDLGFLHLIEELARVGGEGFDVLALSFGKDSVERQR